MEYCLRCSGLIDIQLDKSMIKARITVDKKTNFSDKSASVKMHQLCSFDCLKIFHDLY